MIIVCIFTLTVWHETRFEYEKLVSPADKFWSNSNGQNYYKSFWCTREFRSWQKTLLSRTTKSSQKASFRIYWTAFQTHHQQQQEQQQPKRMMDLIVGSFDILVRQVHKRQATENRSRRWKRQEKRSPIPFSCSSRILFTIEVLLCSLAQAHSDDGSSKVEAVIHWF